MTENWYSDDKATLGDRISAAREAAGLSEEEFADKLGVRIGTLAEWEADETEPRSHYLRTLAGMLGVSLIWLLTGEGQGFDDGDAIPGREAVLTEIRLLQQSISDAARRLERLEKLVVNG